MFRWRHTPDTSNENDFIDFESREDHVHYNDWQYYVLRDANILYEFLVEHDYTLPHGSTEQLIDDELGGDKY